MDDIITGSNDRAFVEKFKGCLSSHFRLKDLGDLKFFLGLEIARSKKGIMVTQRKFILELLEEYGMLGAKPSAIPIDVNTKLVHVQEGLLNDPTVADKL